MSVLPLELIRQIVEDIVDGVDASTYHRLLSAVSLSCRLLRHEAQRLLFREPGALYTRPTASHEKTTRFLDTIISSPDRLGLFVKTFSINFDDLFHPDSEITTGLVQKLSNALGAMHNLEFLDVAQTMTSIPSLPMILQDAPFKLTSFRWSGFSTTACEAADVKIDFLRRQDTIEHLVILSFLDESTLKSIAADICPRLRSLSAPYAITKIILPGKQHITSLRWIPALGEHTIPEALDMDVPCHLISIAKELGRIRYLSYHAIDSLGPIAPKIQHIAPCLMSLVCLDTRRHNIQQVEVLSQLPRLQILILNGGAFESWPLEEAIIKAAASCKSLKHIDIELDYGTFVRSKYDCSSKTLQIYGIAESESYIWLNNFSIFDD